MNLHLLKEKFETIPGLSVSERGTRDAKFLYITSAKRAVEVAETDGGIWIEYWTDTDDEDESRAVKEEIVASGEEALTKIKHWLTAS